MENNLTEYMTADQLFDWAKANMNIIKLNSDMSEDEIARAMRWIGKCSYDTIYMDGDKPRLGRHGINLMLSVTLAEFPWFYEEWGLSQFN